MATKTKVVKVNLKSRAILPRYSDDELTGLAERVGLTLAQLKKLHGLAQATYQYIGHDLGGGKREMIVEVVLDANYLEMANHGRVPADILDWLRNKAHTFNLDHVYQAVGANFPFPTYE